MKISTSNHLNKLTSLHLHTKENSSDHVSSNITHQFDAVTIQSNPRQIVEKTFAESVAQKISSEIAKPSSDEKLQNLHNQIANGTYQADPHAIAFKMLLMGEAM